MKNIQKELFQLKKEESKYDSESQAKIELINCTLDKRMCTEQLSVINKYFHESNEYYHKKEYQRSIEALNLAFNSTYEIHEPSCLKCADLFRSTIISSLENIHLDLQKTTTGWFKAKRFQSSLEMASVVLDELKRKQ